ncbi:type I pantothenate kinase [Enterovibrio nigricans]|uniref:Pantothenate kinase n=1 Tax=Enterovibrio nigricans DSM 22720 TaxID=1121868 RepID=A0A1T4VYL6_9GAMM|nr:type I pantothenate kinase [Enterovibrio nigricans]PKF49143.1 type I pantothenate kinase [Enterovibrio nigricans]SKA69915.1 pantothenate kinase [Enterovibrio nigricans DSM 22720]
MSDLLTPYLSFDRKKWSELRDSVPMTLDETDLEKLRGINEHLTMEEVQDIYLPLSRLLNLYVKARKGRTQVLEQFLGEKDNNVPYVIGIAGSVAVGKSTTARILKALLERWPEHPKVELITTDGFLYSNDTLNDRDLMKKKGFPESYDIRRLVQFVADVKSGKKRVEAPVYSHLVYDITQSIKVVEQPDILIVEGLNVLQSGMDYPHDPHRVFISDFLDFSLFVDADSELLRTWYIERFMQFRRGAFQDPTSYFHHYTKLTHEEAIAKASGIWEEINGKNLVENILPTRERAGLILQKGTNHAVQTVKVRK